MKIFGQSNLARELSNLKLPVDIVDIEEQIKNKFLSVQQRRELERKLRKQYSKFVGGYLQFSQFN